MLYKSTIPELKLKKIKSNLIKKKITTSKDASDYARQFYYDDLSIYESFFLILLNKSNLTIGFVKISQGGIAGTVVDKMIVMKYAIESLASGIILIHNHPSGNTNPSNTDIQLTNNLKECCKLFNIYIFDHVIITEENYYSFADNNLL